MTVPSGTSKVIAHTLGLGAALVGGVFWARGTISIVGVIAIIVSLHLLARIVALAEPESDITEPES